MTNEEAKKILYMEWQRFLEDYVDYAGVSEAYKMAFKALEQEPVLDKIRAEIERMPSELTQDGRRMIRRGNVFRIIDEHKAESEDKE